MGSTNCAAILENGDLYTWGDYPGRDDSSASYHYPGKVTIQGSCKIIAAGYMHSGAITEDGLYVWGASYGDAIPFPEKVTFISPPGYERTPISVLMNPSSMDSYVLTKEGYFYEISIQNQGSITKPDKIKNLSLSDQGDGLVTITIASADDAQGYEIAYSANKKFLKAQTNQKLVSAKSTNGKSVIKLKKGSAYYIRAHAFQKDSAGNNIYAAYSDTKKIKPKK